MELIDDLENDMVYAMLIEKKFNGELGSEEIISLLRKVKDSLRDLGSCDPIELTNIAEIDLAIT